MSIECKIAARDLIQADYRNLRGNERLDTTPRIEELIFIQSLEGRAHNGAGAFRKRSYVNTSIDDIVTALDKDPEQIKEKRQQLIDEIVDFVNRVIAGEKPNKLMSKKGMPLLGIPLFKTKIISPQAVLKGICIGGLRDDADIRSAAEKKYGVTIGYGRCYLINIEVMDSMCLDGEILAHQEHGARIDEFKKNGLILDPLDADNIEQDKIRYFYIRHKLGPGQSDDAAIVCAGFLHHSVDVALGVFLADAIDTLEKYVPDYSDQDFNLGCYIKEKYKDLDVTLDQVYELSYLAAIPESKEDEVPDSSMRYLLTVDPRTGQSTLECHLNFIEGRPFFPMAVSYKRILITSFYEYLKGRLSEVLKTEDILPLGMTGSLSEGLDIPIKELIRKRVITVSQDQPLSVVLKELRNSNADAIIVRDDKGNILGVVDSSDFLHLLDRR